MLGFIHILNKNGSCKFCGNEIFDFVSGMYEGFFFRSCTEFGLCKKHSVEFGRLTRFEQYNVIRGKRIL